MEYLLHIIIMLDIYVMLVLSANLTIGMANLLTLCQAAFYGIGAYIGTFFLMQFNLPFVVIAAAVMLLTGAFSWLVSYASVRLKGDYFVIATMGFQMIVYTVLYNWIDVTRGPYGIPGIPGIKLLGLFELHGVYAYLALSLVAAVLVTVALYMLMRSPFGRTLNAIRADEQVVQSLGRNTAAFKSWAFFISAAVFTLLWRRLFARFYFVKDAFMNTQAGGAARSGDRGAGFHQILDVSFFDAFFQHFIGSGDNDQPGIGCNVFSSQDPGRRGNILLPPAGAGTDIALVQFHFFFSNHFAQRMHVFHAVGTGQFRLQR